MKSRRETMLFSLVSCAGLLAMPVSARQIKRKKIDLLDQFKDIQETGDRMFANRMEIYKMNGKKVTDGRDLGVEEMTFLRSEFSDMIAEKLDTTVHGNHLSFSSPHEIVWLGNIGPAFLNFHFKLHVNDKLNLTKRA
jgi:hypothetical protein